MTKFGFLLLLLHLSSITRAEDPADQEETLTSIVGAITAGNVKIAEQLITQLGDAAPIAQIVHDVYAKTETNIELLINLTASLPDVALSNQILTILSEELQRNGHNDLRNLIVVVKAFKPEMVTDQNFTYPKPNPSLSELIHQISDVASAFLTAVMQSEASYVDNEDVKALAAALSELPTVSSMVMQSLVSDCFPKVDRNKLLEGVYSHSDTWQALQGLYQFFWWLDKAGPLEGDIVLKHAALLSETMKRKDYLNTDPDVKYSFEKVVARIPACARNLFFEPSFCIWSRYQDSYVVASESQDHEHRKIFTAPRENDSLPSGFSWRVQRTGDRLFFVNAAFPDEQLCAADAKYDPRTHHVFGKVPGSNSDDRCVWNVELHGEECCLKNLHFDEYLFASDSTTHKYVLSTKRDDPNATSSAFVWQIRSCEVHKDPLLN